MSGKRENARIERMSLEELREFLRADMAADEQADMDTLLYAVQLLAEREAAAGTALPDVERARAEFMEHYYPMNEEEPSLYDFRSGAEMAQSLTSSQTVRRVERKRGGMLRWLKSGAVAAVLAVMLVGGAIAVSPDVPAIAVNMLARIYDEYVSIRFVSDNEGVELPQIDIGYVPSGYVMIENKNMVGKQHKRLKYENESGERLSVSVWVAYKGLNYNADSEHRQLCYVNLANGVEAHLMLAEEPQYSSSMFWVSADGRLFFTVTGRLSQEELLNIANSIETRDEN